MKSHLYILTLALAAPDQLGEEGIVAVFLRLRCCHCDPSKGATAARVIIR